MSNASRRDNTLNPAFSSRWPSAGAEISAKRPESAVSWSQQRNGQISGAKRSSGYAKSIPNAGSFLELLRCKQKFILELISMVLVDSKNFHEKEKTMVQKVVIVTSMNVSPEEELAERLAPLIKTGFMVVSAVTSISLHGEMDVNEPGSRVDGIARHIYYVTTVILKREAAVTKAEIQRWRDELEDRPNSCEIDHLEDR